MSWHCLLCIFIISVIYTLLCFKKDLRQPTKIYKIRKRGNSGSGKILRRHRRNREGCGEGGEGAGRWACARPPCPPLPSRRVNARCDQPQSPRHRASHRSLRCSPGTKPGKTQRLAFTAAATERGSLGAEGRPGHSTPSPSSYVRQQWRARQAQRESCGSWGPSVQRNVLVEKHISFPNSAT